MALIELPEPWRRDVCAILKTEDTQVIQWTADCRVRYEADFFPAWPYEVYEPLRAFLEGNRPLGCPKKMEKPPGETYEFYFQFRSTQSYGKILLRPDRRRIMLFSAHLPLQERLSCE